MGFAGGFVNPTRGAQIPLSGNLAAHDPSTILREGTTYRYFATGNGIVSKSSSTLTSWSASYSIFGSSYPAWTTQLVPGFTGTFWAPDVAYFNGLYHVYYSVSTFGSNRSAIGLVTSPTLNPADPNFQWTDRGPVINSTPSNNYNTIDASIFRDTNGRTFMTFGSYWNGIYITEIDPNTGLRLAQNPNPVHIAGRGGGSIEASSLIKRGEWYYLITNWGQCCEGVNSTYEIRYGRSRSATGPFFDRNGVDLRIGGGTLLLDDVGIQIGPGHFSLLTENNRNYFSYHYYDGARNGTATFGLRELFWGTDGWMKLDPTAGDAQRDSDVDFADLVQIAPYFGRTSGMSWVNGDFNADGAVDIFDLNLMGPNYEAGLEQFVIDAGTLGLIRVVPEPGAAVALVAIFAQGLRRRR